MFSLLTFSPFSGILILVEFLLFASGVPARAFAFADGVRPPLFSFIIQALFNVSVLFLVEVIVILYSEDSART